MNIIVDFSSEDVEWYFTNEKSLFFLLQTAIKKVKRVPKLKSKHAIKEYQQTRIFDLDETTVKIFFDLSYKWSSKKFSFGSFFSLPFQNGNTMGRFSKAWWKEQIVQSSILAKKMRFIACFGL